MTLQVIGAGLGRTGTLSLKLALEQLGLGPCYHMLEVFKNPAAPDWWSAAADGAPDWEKIFEGYGATVDWPSASFYAQLAQAYPQAKVILTERDPEAWFASTQATIFQGPYTPDSDDPFRRMTWKVIGSLFDGRMSDHDHVIDVYLRHNAKVRETIPADRLLVYDLKQGWAPLCAFLGVPAPDSPMVHVNTTQEFIEKIRPNIPAAPVA